MPIIYCNYNMFTLTSPVVCVQEGKDTYNLFNGNFEEIRNFIVTEYHTHEYEKVILAGPYAKTLENEIQVYNTIKYNLKDIKIEVIE